MNMEFLFVSIGLCTVALSIWYLIAVTTRACSDPPKPLSLKQKLLAVPAIAVIMYIVITLIEVGAQAVRMG